MDGASQIVTVALAATLFLSGCSGLVGQEEPPSKASPTAESSPPATATPAPSVAATSSNSLPVTFAIIGDYGTDDAHERAVARLVAAWDPSFIIATGDDYYAVAGGTGTGRYDESTGAHYGRWLADIKTTGKRYPQAKRRTNGFFPALGNHDYSDAKPSPDTYLAYFRLPGRPYASSSSGNERYYDFVKGPVHFFVLNSNPDEPDGVAANSRQAAWLRAGLAASSSRWNVVYDHHPPYSSDRTHGSTGFMQWPFAAWGADVVLSGHAHTYERIERDGIVYFVNGLGGASRYGFGSTAVAGSRARFNQDWGAQRVTVSEAGLRFEFYDVSGRKVDEKRLSAW